MGGEWGTGGGGEGGAILSLPKNMGSGTVAVAVGHCHIAELSNIRHKNFRPPPPPPPLPLSAQTTPPQRGGLASSGGRQIYLNTKTKRIMLFSLSFLLTI